MSTLTIVFAIAWVVVGFAILYTMAGARGRNPVLWGIFGALTFVVALVVLLVVGRSDDPEPRTP